MRTITGALLICLLTFTLVVGCKTESDKEPDTATIEEQMREVGHEAANEIKSSLQKAEDAGQLQSEHYKQLEDEQEPQ